jgi:hypothetical protein
MRGYLIETIEKHRLINLKTLRASPLSEAIIEDRGVDMKRKAISFNNLDDEAKRKKMSHNVMYK